MALKIRRPDSTGADEFKVRTLLSLFPISVSQIVTFRSNRHHNGKFFYGDDMEDIITFLRQEYRAPEDLLFV